MHHGLYGFGELLQLLAQVVELLLLGNSDAARLAHSGLEFSLSLQEVEGFVDGLHDWSPGRVNGKSNVSW